MNSDFFSVEVGRDSRSRDPGTCRVAVKQMKLFSAVSVICETLLFCWLGEVRKLNKNHKNGKVLKVFVFF